MKPNSIWHNYYDLQPNTFFYTIHWTNDIPVNFENNKKKYGKKNLYDEGRRQVYLILSKKKNHSKKIEYIGKVDRNNCLDRINDSNHKIKKILNDNLENSIYVRFGRIHLQKDSVKDGMPINKSEIKATPELLSNVESVLINEIQPPYNQMSKKCYLGKNHILIYNCGYYHPLNKIIDSKDLKCWISK